MRFVAVDRDLRLQNEFIWLRKVTVKGFSECGNESSGSRNAEDSRLSQRLVPSQDIHHGVIRKTQMFLHAKGVRQLFHLTMVCLQHFIL